MADSRDNISAATAAAHRRARWVAVVALLAIILIAMSMLQLCSAPREYAAPPTADSVLEQKATAARARVDSLAGVLAADPAQADRAALPMIQAVMEADTAISALGYMPSEALRATVQAAVAAARRALEAQRDLYDDIDRLKARCERRLARLDSAEAIYTQHCKSFTTHAL